MNHERSSRRHNGLVIRLQRWPFRWIKTSCSSPWLNSKMS